MDLKDALARLMAKLAELENAARKLQNQNFADIVKSAHGKLAQASDHPDLGAVETQLRGDLEDREGAQLPFPPPPQPFPSAAPSEQRSDSEQGSG